MKIRWFSVFVLFILGFVFPFPVCAEVAQVAPGVYFRPAQGYCNVGWVVFEDYVLVIDSSVQKDAVKIIEDIRETTNKPIRFVFNTHHHWDHAYGNGVFAREGATIVSSEPCRDLLQEEIDANPEKFSHDETDMEDVENMKPTLPSITFEDLMVFDDGKQRVELLHFGHGHTKGDAVAYLPEHNILFTGDACVNGAFNYMGEAHINEWKKLLSHLQGYDIKTICPGHGELADKELLVTQKKYFIQLEEQVQASVDEGLSLEETQKNVDIPWYKDWTGQEPTKANIRYMYRYLSGLITPWEVLEHAWEGGKSYSQDTPGWKKPEKMLVRWMSNQEMKALKIIAPDMEFVQVRSDEEIMREIEDADAVVGRVNQEQLAAAEKLKWVHSPSAGVEGYLYPEFVESPVTLTNGQGMMGPAIADHVLGMTLMFTKALAVQHERKLQAKWGQDRSQPIMDLEDKTMLILGLGGIGSEVAERAKGFGMLVKAIDPRPMEKPHWISSIGKPDELHDLLPEADVVACCVPLTEHTYRYFGKEEFDLMKPTSYFINIARGKVVVQEELVDALKNGDIAGAGLDVTDPEPLPEDHELWELKNVVITPHMSARTVESGYRRNLLLRENIRRFAKGEPLLNVVDKEAGY